MIKERIVLAPGANSTELLRSLALYGQGCFAMRIYSSAYSLAADMLTRKGILNSNVVSDTEVQYMINSAMKKVEAFKNASFTDASNIASSIKTLRNLIVCDEKAQMEKLVKESGFASKNQNLLEVYDAYRKMLSGRKDRIDVIREALNNEYELDTANIEDMATEWAVNSFDEFLQACEDKGIDPNDVDFDYSSCSDITGGFTRNSTWYTMANAVTDWDEIVDLSYVKKKSA